MNIKLLKKINEKLPKPVHPFNLQKNGVKSYAEWQYENGEKTVKFYLEYEKTTDNMFKNKKVLDIGCGAGGKSIYYANKGANKVIGVDIIEKYKKESERLAIKKGLTDKFEYYLNDAANLSFEDNMFDVIIMNDAMEHVDKPKKVLKECLRVLKKGGKLYINFPPYHHPYGAHLSDVIAIPWVHLLASESKLITLYKDLLKDNPEKNERINFRISQNEEGIEYFSYINKMTIKRFNKILKELDINPLYYKEVPLRKYFYILARIPFIKEMFNKMVVCIIEK